MAERQLSVRLLLRAIGSLRLAVTLLAAAMVLIFVGTIAQTRVGVWEAVETYFRSPVAWVDPAIFMPGAAIGDAGSGFRVPLPGGALIGALLVMNIIAAYVLRARLTWRWFGVLMLHAGLVVLIVGEFVTGVWADEGLMRIDEGGSSSFVEDLREVELVLVEFTGEATDRVIRIPQRMVERAARTGEPIVDPQLPVDVHVLRWTPNSTLVPMREAAAVGREVAGGWLRGESVRVTHGLGLRYRAMPTGRARGVDGGTDAPAALVRLESDGRRLGTWLTAADFVRHQAAPIGDRRWGLSLRFRRTYKPYRLELIDFRHDKFTGTQIARNFSSDVRLIDPDRGVDRKVRIWMNHPLRYRGETFYQASYKPDGSGTVLQVVRNPGWLLPYAACLLVGLGMSVHFGGSLAGYLRRRNRGDAGRGAAPAADRWIPRPRGGPLDVAVVSVAVAAALLIALSGLFRGSPHGGQPGADLDAAATLPVSADGRVKPLDTAARNLLMVAGGRDAAHGKDRSLSGLAYLFGLVARPESIAIRPHMGTVIVLPL